MGLTTFKGDLPVMSDVIIAKNYLTEEELKILNKIHNQDFNLVEFDQIKTEYGRNYQHNG